MSFIIMDSCEDCITGITDTNNLIFLLLTKIA